MRLSFTTKPRSDVSKFAAMESLQKSADAIPARIFVGGFDEQTNEAELYQAFQVIVLMCMHIIRQVLSVLPSSFINFLSMWKIRVSSACNNC